MKKLNREFYNRDSIIVAQELLGKVLVHEVDGVKISAKIVETEAYMGVEDKAAHSYGGRRTQRVEVMYGGPGFSYVFFVYGMHCCFNMVTREEGNPQAVLIRAVEPVGGLEQMAENRYGKQYSELTKRQVIGLTNGPGKLCQAMAISRSQNGEDLCGESLYVEDGENDLFEMVAAKRIGVDYAQEASEYLWRFYRKESQYVSVK